MSYSHGIGPKSWFGKLKIAVAFSRELIVGREFRSWFRNHYLKSPLSQITASQTPPQAIVGRYGNNLRVHDKNRYGTAPGGWSIGRSRGSRSLWNEPYIQIGWTALKTPLYLKGNFFHLFKQILYRVLCSWGVSAGQHRNKETWIKVGISDLIVAILISDLLHLTHPYFTIESLFRPREAVRARVLLSSMLNVV